MRKLVINTFITLDGVMQAPGGPEEDTTGGFEHGGWSFGYWDEAMGNWMGEAMGKPFALLLGRKTYEIFAAYWPQAGDQPGAAELNAATKYVASRTLDSVEWANSVLLEDDAAEAVARLKDADGPEIQVHGSSDLIQTLLANQLVDEFRVWIFPVVLGSGKRLFGAGTTPAGLELVDSKTSTSGVLVATYRPAGEPKYGSFAAGRLGRQYWVLGELARCLGSDAERHGNRRPTAAEATWNKAPAFTSPQIPRRYSSRRGPSRCSTLSPGSSARASRATTERNRSDALLPWATQSGVWLGESRARGHQ